MNKLIIGTILTIVFVSSITCINSEIETMQKKMLTILKAERKENQLKEDARQQWLRNKHYKSKKRPD